MNKIRKVIFIVIVLMVPVLSQALSPPPAETYPRPFIGQIAEKTENKVEFENLHGFIGAGSPVSYNFEELTEMAEDFKKGELSEDWKAAEDMEKPVDEFLRHEDYEELPEKASEAEVGDIIYSGTSAYSKTAFYRTHQPLIIYDSEGNLKHYKGMPYGESFETNGHELELNLKREDCPEFNFDVHRDRYEEVCDLTAQFYVNDSSAFELEEGGSQSVKEIPRIFEVQLKSKSFDYGMDITPDNYGIFDISFKQVEESETELKEEIERLRKVERLAEVVTTFFELQNRTEEAEKWKELKNEIKTRREEKEEKLVSPDEINLELSEPITIERTAFYRDGGTLGASLEGAEGETVTFSLDQSIPLDYRDEDSYVYVGGIHPDKEGASQIDWGGETESELLELLQEAEPAEDASKTVAGRLIQKLEERTGETLSCYIGGCSGEVCSSREGVVTTCEHILGMGCIDKADCKPVEGECKWVLTEEAAECFQEKNKETERDLKDTRIGYFFEKAEEKLSGDKEVDIEVGETEKVELEANRTTGNEWHYEIDNPDVLEVVLDEYISYRQDPTIKDDVAGMGGERVLKLKGAKSGKATVSLEYYPPWDPENVVRDKEIGFIIED